MDLEITDCKMCKQPLLPWEVYIVPFWLVNFPLCEECANEEMRSQGRMQ